MKLPTKKGRSGPALTLVIVLLSFVAFVPTWLFWWVALLLNWLCAELFGKGFNWPHWAGRLVFAPWELMSNFTKDSEESLK